MNYEVITEHRALLVETNDPVLMLQKVPAAFRMDDTGPGGSGVLGMPHDCDTVTRLAYMGVKVPSPILYYYDWPRERTLIPEPFAHQKETAAFMVTYPHSFVLNDIGTGKTMSALWAMDFLMQEGLLKRALLTTPLSTLERVWGDALYFHFKHRTFNVLHGAAARRKKLLAQERDFYIINHDGINVVGAELAQRPDINGVDIDEVAVYRNKNERWKAMDRLLYPTKGAPRAFAWGLTGAPIPNSPEDAFHQCKLVTPTSVPKYFTQWRNMVMDHQSTYVWTPRVESTKIVYEAMRPAIRFTRDECLDLPPCIIQTRDVDLSADQSKHYKAVMKELYTEVQGGKVTAVNEGVKLSKLLQIACGVVYDIDGTPREIDPGNRLETLMEVIEQINEKVIIFVPFTAVTGMLARELNQHWNFAVVTGDTPPAERNKIFLDFQNPAIDMDIIAHPGCMSHGLTLTEASSIIWYAPIDSNDTFQQANGRITRAGQKYTANIILLAGSAVERKMYKRLEARQNTQGMLLEMVSKGEQ